ncbi:MAG: helix-turn-helix domain-containing protein [Pseudomonadota bacterium]
MSKSYGQYCPLALAAELLCERWTLLVVSRLIDGCVRFNEIHRGVPRISATLLSKRLAELEHAGIAVRKPVENGRGYEYHLTEAGKELEPIVMDLAVWGQKWSRDMVDEDLDPAFLAWSMHTRLNTDAMPKGRTVIEFEFVGIDKGFSRFWLVHNDGVVDMCMRHPGYETDIKVMSDIRRFVEAWRGFRCLKTEIANGHIRLEGMQKHRRALPKWLALSALSPFPRRHQGVEEALCLERA